MTADNTRFYKANPELDNYLAWLSQQTDWNKIAAWRLGPAPYTEIPMMMLSQLVRTEPPPHGTWLISFMEHHNMVELAAALIMRAQHLAILSGETSEVAVSMTWDMVFDRVQKNIKEFAAGYNAHREAQP